MSGLVLKSLSSAENEFLAEETIVSISPHFNHPQFRLISGIFGPMTPSIPCQVPLWFAITLRKKGKCSIITPNWMTILFLEQAVSNEKIMKTLSDLPFHYIEISKLILINARDDIASPDQVAVLIQDLEEIRIDRIRSGIKAIAETVSRNESVVSANLNNVAAMEIHTIKRFFLESMEKFFWFLPPTDETNNEEVDESNVEDEENRDGGRKLRRFRND
jgi:GINS complex subunit 2